jgi:hypothetical protein
MIFFVYAILFLLALQIVILICVDFTLVLLFFFAWFSVLVFDSLSRCLLIILVALRTNILFCLHLVILPIFLLMLIAVALPVFALKLSVLMSVAIPHGVFSLVSLVMFLLILVVVLRL